MPPFSGPPGALASLVRGPDPCHGQKLYEFLRQRNPSDRTARSASIHALTSQCHFIDVQGVNISHADSFSAHPITFQKRISNIYLAGSLIAEYTRPIGAGPTTISYLHTDALGSPIAKTNSSGTVIETSEYEPYGDLLNRANDDRAGYTGHVMDAASGLTYMQQRYYDPAIGRFLSVDPVNANSVTGSNFNRYNYAANNPYLFTDPDGRVIRFRDYATAKFKEQFYAASKYLDDTIFGGKMAAVSAHNETIYIEQGAGNFVVYDPNTKTVFWDPLAALKTTDGGTMSPALALGHEFDHALQDLLNLINRQPTGDDYDDTEEQRVIDGAETEAASALGEDTRTDHRGKNYPTTCPTCRDEAPPPRREDE